VFANDTHEGARTLLADTMEQVGWGAENGTWRNAFLAGATELRDGVFGTPAGAAPQDFALALTPSQIFDAIAVRVDGPRVWDEHLVVSWHFTDRDERYVTELRNGVLHHRRVDAPLPDTTLLTLDQPSFVGIVTQTIDLQAAVADGRVAIDGDMGDLLRLVTSVDQPDPNFDIVTP
jgi:alkyl sulfatase BDS1-like metallo-beta-lactamase superfamily hydrolase